MRNIRILLIVGVAAISRSTWADCEKLAHDYDWNARNIARASLVHPAAPLNLPPAALLRFYDSQKASNAQFLATLQSKSQMIYQAMIAEKCQLPSVDAEQAYFLEAIACNAEQMPIQDSLKGKCDHHQWVGKQ